jgi:hypothetical protein
MTAFGPWPTSAGARDEARVANKRRVRSFVDLAAQLSVEVKDDEAVLDGEIRDDRSMKCRAAKAIAVIATQPRGSRRRAICYIA